MASNAPNSPNEEAERLEAFVTDCQESSWLGRFKAVKSSVRFIKLVFAMKAGLLLFAALVLPTWDIVSDYMAAHKHFK